MADSADSSFTAFLETIFDNKKLEKFRFESLRRKNVAAKTFRGVLSCLKRRLGRELGVLFISSTEILRRKNVKRAWHF